MLDDPRKPFDELLTPKNVYDRVRALETKQTEPSATVGSNEDLTISTGTQIVGNLISPAPDVESTDPTDTAFTGSFVSGDGQTFNSEVYNIGGVNAGVLQWGAKQTDGKISAGAGAVTIDADGITVQQTSSTPGVPNIVKVGNIDIYDASNGSGSESVIQNADTAAAGEYRAIVLRSQNSGIVDTNLCEFYMQSSTDNSNITASTTYGNVGSQKTATISMILNASNADISVNYGNNDVDTSIYGTSATPVIKVDAGANTAAINGIDMTPSTATFTPTIDGTTTPGAGTYTTQAGVYFKIGKLVNFSINFTWTAHTGTGNIQISGLPFTSANNGISYPLAVFFNNLTLAAVGNKVEAFVSNNSTIVGVREIGSGAIALIPMDTAGTLNVSGWYLAA